MSEVVVDSMMLGVGAALVLINAVKALKPTQRSAIEREREAEAGFATAFMASYGVYVLASSNRIAKHGWPVHIPMAIGFSLMFDPFMLYTKYQALLEQLAESERQSRERASMWERLEEYLQQHNEQGS